MPETYDLKQLASHFLSLNSTWSNAVNSGLLWAITTITIDSEVLYLKPNGINTVETRTVKNDKKEDVQQARMNTHTFEDYSDVPETLFLINKAIFTKLNKFISFDLAKDHVEYNIYL